MALITISDSALPTSIVATQTTEPLENAAGDQVGRVVVTLAYLPQGKPWSVDQVNALLDDEMATMEVLP